MKKYILTGAMIISILATKAQKKIYKTNCTSSFKFSSKNEKVIIDKEYTDITFIIESNGQGGGVIVIENVVNQLVIKKAVTIISDMKVKGDIHYSCIGAPKERFYIQIFSDGTITFLYNKDSKNDYFQNGSSFKINNNFD